MDLEEQGLRGAMEEFKLDLGMGMKPSAQNILKSLTFTMGITLAALGLIKLVLAGSAATPGRHTSDGELVEPALGWRVSGVELQVPPAAAIDPSSVDSVGGVGCALEFEKGIVRRIVRQPAPMVGVKMVDSAQIRSERYAPADLNVTREVQLLNR